MISSDIYQPKACLSMKTNYLKSIIIAAVASLSLVGCDNGNDPVIDNAYRGPVDLKIDLLYIDDTMTLGSQDAVLYENRKKERFRINDFTLNNVTIFLQKDDLVSPGINIDHLDFSTGFQKIIELTEVKEGFYSEIRFEFEQTDQKSFGFLSITNEQGQTFEMKTVSDYSLVIPFMSDLHVRENHESLVHLEVRMDAIFDLNPALSIQEISDAEFQERFLRGIHHHHNH
jgi:hypothetical protein